MKRLTAFLACLGLAAVAGCAASPTEPFPSAPYTQTDLRIGTGPEVTAGMRARVYYSGWLYDPGRPDSKGGQFDSNVGQNAPLEFTVGVGQVIQGWEQGLPGMRVGGLRRLVIPPSLGYGAIRQGPIPPYSTLVFDVELVGLAQPEPE